jgi:SAM-dependent methyltransferase
MKLPESLSRTGKVLDIGCNVGATAEYFQKENYYGVDNCEPRLKIAKEKGLNVFSCDIRQEPLPFEDQTFDTIICSHIIEHLLTEEQHLLMAEMARVLKIGGKLFVSAPTPYNPFFWDEETHQRPCTHGQLSVLARKHGLKVIEAKYSAIAFLSNQHQRYARWLLMPFLWEAYIIAEKPLVSTETEVWGKCSHRI